jgi:hypothetical protein
MDNLLNAAASAMGNANAASEQLEKFRFVRDKGPARTTALCVAAALSNRNILRATDCLELGKQIHKLFENETQIYS